MSGLRWRMDCVRCSEAGWAMRYGSECCGCLWQGVHSLPLASSLAHKPTFTAHNDGNVSQWVFGLRRLTEWEQPLGAGRLPRILLPAHHAHTSQSSQHIPWTSLHILLPHPRHPTLDCTNHILKHGLWYPRHDPRKATHNPRHPTYKHRHPTHEPRHPNMTPDKLHVIPNTLCLITKILHMISGTPTH